MENKSMQREISARTINGVAVEEVFRQLTEEFDASSISHMDNGYPFLSYYTYHARLVNTVGIANFDFVTGDMEHCIIGDEEWLMCSGTLIIKDDRGLAVKTTKAYGAADISKNSSGKVVSVGNDAEMAAQNAFCKCFKLISVKVAKQLVDIRAQMKSNSGQGVNFEQRREEGFREGAKNANINSSSGNVCGIPGFGKAFPMPEKETGSVSNEKQKKIYHVKLLKSLTSLPGGYKSDVYVYELDKNLPFRIFKEGIESIESCGIAMSVFAEQLQRDAEFSFLGFLNTFKGTEQIVMEAVAGN